MTNRMGLRTLTSGLLATTLLASPVFGEAVLDGTTGSTGSFSGDFEIPAEVGRRAGANLFHSFERFHIRLGESATFTGPGGIDNVVSRVTGDEASRINGVLRSTVPGADFWFLNPRGVVFGRGAQLDIDGSFHATTADELRFRDGSVFSATDPNASSFTVAVPEAFGFLGETSGSIQVNRSQLAVDRGESLSLVGGNVRITGGGNGVASGGQSGRILAAGGTLTLAALAGPAAIEPDTGTVTADAGRNVTITGEASVDASGQRGGIVRVRSGRLVVDQSSSLSANTVGGAGTGEVSIVTDRAAIRSGGLVTADTLGAGDAGRIEIDARRLTVAEDGRIRSEAREGSSGDAGSIKVQANEVVLIEGAAISSSTLGAGNAGRVSVESGAVAIDGRSRLTGITADALSSSGGTPGTLQVDAGQLFLVGQAQISSSTFSTGSGGSVRVTADEIAMIGGDQLAGIFTNANPGATGDAGNLDVVAGLISIGANSVISSSTFGVGAAGSVRVQANDIVIDPAGGLGGIFNNADRDSIGDGGSLQVGADTLVIVNGGAISSSTFGTGSAGAVRVTAANLFIDGGNIPNLFTGIANQAEPGSSGPAGSVRVVADVLRIQNGGFISSNTFAAGNGGPVSVEADSLTILGNGGISSETRSIGDAGAVTILVRGDLVVNALGGDARISSSALEGGSGRGGVIVVRADGITLVEGGRIIGVTQGSGNSGAITVEARTLTIDGVGIGGSVFTGIASDAEEGTGNAGAVVVRAGDLVLRDDGQIRSDTRSSGSAGPVTVEAERQVRMSGGRLTGISSDAVGGSSGDAGPVTVTAGRIRVLDGAFISSSVSEGAGGRGGVVVVRADHIRVADRGRIIGVTAGSGDSGAITVEAGTLTINGAGRREFTGITSDANEEGTGNAGPILVRADTLAIRNGGRISSDARSTGNAGPVVVDAGQLTITGGTGLFTQISSDSLSESGDGGDAGNVLVTTGRLFVDAGGSISSSTSGGGRAGQVLIVTDDGVVRGGIATRSTGAGAAGTIALAAERFRIEDDGIVTSAGDGAGPAGNILLRTGVLTLDRAQITTQGELGGLITTDAGAVLRIQLVDSQVTSTGIEPREGASIITLTADNIVLSSSRVESLTGEGEPITGSGEARLLGDLTVISIDSTVEASSTLEVTGLESDLTAGIEVLPTAYIDVSRLLRESCAARASNRTSSFTASGAGGIAPDPSAPLAGQYAVGGWSPTPAAFPLWALSGGDRCDD